MEVKIVYDNKSKNESFLSGWGFSCLIGKKILFDTGENGASLLENLSRLDIDISAIEMIVVSHDHWDHTGGLQAIMKRGEDFIVYVCPCFSEGLKNSIRLAGAKLKEIDGLTEILDGIYTTGEIPGNYKGDYLGEQSLVIKKEGKVSIATGCAHPGIVKIIKRVKKNFPQEKINLVFGGFHLKDKSEGEVKEIVEEFREMGVEKVGPTHCTGLEAENVFRKAYEDNFIPVKSGEVFQI